MGKKNRKQEGAKGSDHSTIFSTAVKNLTKEVSEELIKLCVAELPPIAKLGNYFQELYSLATKLIEAQKGYCLTKSLPASSDARRERLQQLFSELQKDLDLNSCGVDIFEDEGFGLVATKDLPKHSNILRIPVNKFISTDKALSSNIGDFIKTDKIVSTMPNISLALYVLSELSLGSASEWHFYLASLPPSFDTALYLKPSDVVILKGSPALESVVRNFRNICRQYAYLYQLMEVNPSTSCFSFNKAFCFEDYRWAVSAVMSRNNQLPLLNKESPQDYNLALIPIWDMMNHKPVEMTTDFSPESSSIVFYTMEDCPAGSQIYIHYGKRTNSDFFTFSGFVPQENPHDKFPVKLGISDYDPQHAKKTQLLQRLCLESSQVFCLTPENCLPQEIVAFARVFSMEEDELDRYLAFDSLPDVTNSILTPEVGQGTCSSECEKAAVVFLRSRFKLLLAAYRTDSEKDLALLECGELTPSERRCMLLKISERKYLTRAIYVIVAKATYLAV